MELLRKMLELYTPCGDEHLLAEFLHDALPAWGFQTEVDGAGNLIARVGRGPKNIFLVGHMDTVSGEIPVRVEAGKLYGRGAVDAKGSLAAFIESAKNFRDSQALTIWVIGCVGEEDDSRGAEFLLEQDYRPDFVVIGEPSGGDAITLGYRGSFWVFYELERPLTHPGHAAPTVAEEAVRFYNELKRQYPPGPKAFDAVDIRLVEVHARARGFTELVEMILNVRTPLNFAYEEFQRLVQLIGGEADLLMGDPTPAFRAEKNNALVRAFLKAIRAHGGRPSFKLKTGTSDMNLLGPAWGVPIVAYGPGDSALDHTPHEHLALAEYERAKEILGTALRELAT